MASSSRRRPTGGPLHRRPGVSAARLAGRGVLRAADLRREPDAGTPAGRQLRRRTVARLLSCAGRAADQPPSHLRPEPWRAVRGADPRRRSGFAGGASRHRSGLVARQGQRRVDPRRARLPARARPRRGQPGGVRSDGQPEPAFRGRLGGSRPRVRRRHLRRPAALRQQVRVLLRAPDAQGASQEPLRHGRRLPHQLPVRQLRHAHQPGRRRREAHPRRAAVAPLRVGAQRPTRSCAPTC
jgi:hypothetical protein